MENTANVILNDLLLLRNDEKARFLQGFFKTGKGQYAEGDKFLGIVVPEQRKVAKNYYKNIDINELHELLISPWHECRLTALIILVLKMEKEKNQDVARSIVDFYLAHTQYINNWDLVDLSAPYILGKYLMDKDKTLLTTLAETGQLWQQRISIITTLYFVRKSHFNTSFLLAEILIYHPHDLIHKAVGWVLREIGKRDETAEKKFLDRYYQTMSRTMLRYAIERLDKEDKAFYMAKK